MKTQLDESLVLRLLLRLVAVGVGVRIVFVFAPVPWSAWLFERMGVGPCPNGPVMDYLVHATSLAYALAGIFCWLIASDLRRYEPHILFLGWASVAFGFMVAGVETACAAPPFWALALAGSAVFLGALILWLTRRAALGRSATGQGLAPGGARELIWETHGERWVRRFLRAMASVMSLGLVGVALPPASLAQAYGTLGFGDYPAAPLFHFMLRSWFASVCLGGVLFWLVTREMQRSRPVIVFLAWSSVVYGVVMTAVEWQSPLPVGWRMAAGTAAVVPGVALLLSLKGFPAAR